MHLKCWQVGFLNLSCLLFIFCTGTNLSSAEDTAGEGLLLCFTVQTTAKIAIAWPPRKCLLLYRYGGGFSRVDRCLPLASLAHTQHMSKNKEDRKERDHASRILFLCNVFFLVASPTPRYCIILYIVAPKCPMYCSILVYLQTFCTDESTHSFLVLKPPRESSTLNVKGYSE